MFEQLELRQMLSATLVTDKADYDPGSTAKITGSGFAAGETVTLQVTHVAGTAGSNADAQNQPWQTTADENGNVSAAWAVTDPDCIDSSYLLTAQGSTSGEGTETNFTDAASNTPTRITLLNNATVNPGSNITPSALLEWFQAAGANPAQWNKLRSSLVTFSFQDASGNTVGATTSASTPANALGGNDGIATGSSMTVPAGAVKLVASYAGKFNQFQPTQYDLLPASTSLNVVTGSSIQTVNVDNVPTKVLVIVGTAGNDIIAIDRYTIIDPATSKPAWRVSLNGVRTYFDDTNAGGRPADGLFIVGGAGIDKITVQVVQNYAGADDLNVPTVIDGGAGNDEMYGGKGASMLIGGSGSDKLTGYLGNDIVVTCGLRAGLTGDVSKLLTATVDGSNSAAVRQTFATSKDLVDDGQADFVADYDVDTVFASKGDDVIFMNTGDILSDPFGLTGVGDWIVTL